MRILVVEDDPGIGFLLETILATHKYAVDVATDGQAGLDLSDVYEYDAILLDVTLPKKDGISVCREIRAKGNTVPILLLTALDSAADRTRGLDAGADDYLSKPFDRDELLARLRAILRRSHAPTAPILTWGSLQLDPVSTDVTFGDRLVPVTPKEYALLELFLRNSKRVFSCNAILDHLCSFDTPGEDVIRTHIKGLRHKLKQVGAAADFIETVYGIGYRLKPIESSGATLLTDTWEKFKGQVHEQVAILEQLAVRFFNQDLQSDWQAIGKNIAHSLTGSLGTFGFSLSSELARQIEKLLGSDRDLTTAQGQLLLSLVTALREELDRPIVTTDLHSFTPDLTTDILLVSADRDLNCKIQSMATDFRSVRVGDSLPLGAASASAERLRQRGWNVQIVPTIAAARSQLHRDRTRSILLTEAESEQTEAVLGLLVEINRQVPLVPVIALTNPDRLDPIVQHLGNWTSVCPTKIADLMESIDRAIAEAESAQTHVLVVDDDLKILAILHALLLPWGFKITTLADSQKFWEILPMCKPDLLILDVEMPIVSGLDLCKSIRDRAEYANLPIIFLTAHTEPTLIQQVFAIGADDFVTKPVIGPEIIARITNLMERQQIQKLKSAQWQRIDAERVKLATKAKIQAALMAINAAVSADNTLQARQSRPILEQVDILCKLLLDPD
ncbi:response regulator [Chamaesiphon sp. OTE_8_metabat_110]|uniref:response regulator n=1 Tax=Chamaesiphon sp. OTE_8_metabat_110 TaxID=2964696 RepID=UPI00286CA8CD|nr:response regulator [Chamaesiphon sp. OTE_8_metabat_110]